VGDTGVSLLFGNKGLPLFKMVAESVGESWHKMADLFFVEQRDDSVQISWKS